MMVGMPDTVVLAWLFVVSGVLIAGLCITRMVSVHGNDFGRRRKILEWVVLSLAESIAVVVAVSSGTNAVILHYARAITPGKMYLIHGYRMHMDCMGSG